MGDVPEIGSVVAERYEILASAGQTPARLAFTAFDREVEVELTLWWVKAGLFEDDMASEIFEHNVRAMRKIKSPHLLKIFDFGQGKLWDGYYLTLQLGSSQEFESLLESPAPVNSDTFLHFARALAAGIEAAYEHGYYHSWLSPADVVAVGGQVKVSGVGLFAGVPQLQVVGALDGNTRYVAPEILAGGEGSPASDIYTIAVMLLDLSIGGEGSIGDKSAKLREQEPDRWQALSGGLSENPNDRPSSATQMIASLAFLGLGEETSQPVSSKKKIDGNESAGQDSPESESTFDDYIGGRNLLEDEEQSGEYNLEHPEVGDSEDVFVSEVVAPAVEQGAKAEHSDSLSESAIVSELDSVDAEDTVINLEAKAKVKARPSSRSRTTGARNQGAANEFFSGFEEKKKGNGGYWALAVAALIAGGAALLLSSLQSSASSGEASPVVAIDAGAIALDSGSAAVTPLPVCPVGMLHLAERQLCIDAYESPGLGKVPTTGLSLGAAQSDCKDRGVRLCRAEEWEYACRRKGTQSFSYGDRFQTEICNLRSGALAPAGSKGECHSEAGVYDLNGNAAEWVEEGGIRGGSALDESEGRCSSERAKPDRQASYSDVGFRCCADGLASASASD